MTKLLVSVRDAWEAREALAGGAAIIDVKEPQRGPLGAADSATWREVRRVLSTTSNNDVRLSAALGELLEDRQSPDADALTGFSFAKVGLAGCGRKPDWQDRWLSWLAELPTHVAPVAVVYADYRSAAGPTPWQVLEVTGRSRARTLLIDTYDKSAGNVLQAMSACELAEIIEESHAAGFQVALAGSISLECLDDALRFQPDWVAVRGGVCQGGRNAILDRQLVERFAVRLSTPRVKNARSQHEKMFDSVSHHA